MLIPITAPAGSGEVQQWAMIEMQGEIERKDGGSLEEAFDVGTLSVSTSGDKVLCTIGYHQLEGTRMPLKKPLAVLERCGSGNQGGVRYEVVGVIRDKYMFKARPRALITKPEDSKAKS